MVFERLPIQCEAFVVLTFAAFDFLVEAAFGFVAQPLALEHLAEKVGELEVAALVKSGGRRCPPHTFPGHVGDNVAEDVEADKVNGAEGCRPGPADCQPGQCIHFFYREIQFLHQPHHIEH